MSKLVTAEDVVARIGTRPIHLVHYAGTVGEHSTFRCLVDGCGHQWSASVSNLTSRGRERGCPKCANRIPLTIEDIIKKLDGTGVELVTYGGSVNRSSKFRCADASCGYEWTTTVGNFTGRTIIRCPKCSGHAQITESEVRRALVGRNIELLSYAGNTHGISTFRCMDQGCGHIWTTSTKSVLGAGTGCGRCAGKVRVTLDVVEKRLQGLNVKLLEYGGFAASHSIFQCTSDGCGHVWLATLANINKGRGCPACAEYGFNPGKPATFYAYRITCRNDTYLGFGITGDFAERSARHQKSFRDHGATGELIFTYDGDGHAIQEIERTAIEQFEITNTGIPGFIREATLYADWKVAVLKSLCAEAEPLAISTQTL